MPYADYEQQKAFQALWYFMNYHAPGRLGREFRERESERKARHWRETMTEQEKDRRRRKARLGMRRIRARRRKELKASSE